MSKDRPKCKYCQSDLVSHTVSLHVWVELYECGLKIVGAVDDPKGDVMEGCLNELSDIIK